MIRRVRRRVEACHSLREAHTHPEACGEGWVCEDGGWGLGCVRTVYEG